MRTAITLFSLVFLVASVAVQAQIYKWVDENGVVHYSSTPPPSDAEAQRVAPERKASDEAEDEDAEASAEEPGDGEGGDAEGDDDEDRGEMCATAISELASTIDGYMEGVRKNLKSGHMTQEQYDETKATFSQMQAEATMSDCQSATGQDLELYRCLAENYGDIMMCGGAILDK